jgi:hypothetical protein
VSLAVIDASELTAYYAADDPRREAVAARLAAGDPHTYAQGQIWPHFRLH